MKTSELSAKVLTRAADKLAELESQINNINAYRVFISRGFENFDKVIESNEFKKALKNLRFEIVDMINAPAYINRYDYINEIAYYQDGTVGKFPNFSVDVKVKMIGTRKPWAIKYPTNRQIVELNTGFEKDKNTFNNSMKGIMIVSGYAGSLDREELTLTLTLVSTKTLA